MSNNSYILIIIIIAFIFILSPIAGALTMFVALLNRQMRNDTKCSEPMVPDSESEYKKILDEISNNVVESADNLIVDKQLINGGRNKIATDTRHHWSKSVVDNYEAPPDIWWGDDAEETATKHTMNF